MSYIISVFSDFSKIKPATLSIIIAILFAAFLFYILRNSVKFNVKMLVYGGLAIAISFVLSYIRFYHWPQGGSITPASMLPLFVFAYYYGAGPGILVGMAYGMLQLIQDPYVVHWIQLLLDYPLAFGALGLAGFFKKNLSLGVLVGGFGRFFSHFLSGVFFFASYAPKGMNPVVYSLLVNGILVGVEVLICFVVSIIPQVRNAIDIVKKRALA
ncbi:energy-coupled thiamine transporter ThiT [Thermoanaerobacterium thermosaccharolyticum]|jgi:probable proton-coupled thiamine transporter YuaJ|uniref:energy-coupled thiamine transporter ThiT n=1 Tax=Thermoanaerobacterium TaxID=28895 RepID=UPI0026DEFF48|nr:energy-coupled thiamine transporter ThiT [Thermoanaerobacterium sp. CMT5567-10]MDK2805977.1 thiamine transporter [Thermoanaerobacterium sp.]WHE07377.1 energy-coupled thiamine transporter ThiT [Thermoanaerobacterium thermosaccharolyticum]WKV07801.1 energy-coupled thiamine transporter ThiT [Thermoanaerobacterium sp. CMT5567-10]